MINLYSIKNAIKITGKVIKKLEVWARCIYVTFENGQTRFISKSAFFNLFHQPRKERAQNLYISHYGQSLYQVEGFNRNFYFVELDKDRIICECKDYREQQVDPNIKYPICKHGWRALNYIGCNSLSEYIRSGKYYSLQEA